MRDPLLRTAPRLVVLLGALLAAAVSAGDPPPNVLLLVADDVGVDRVGVYGEHPDPGHTPQVDALAERGVLFRRAWSNPSCSPTRATLLTGRYTFRTGVGEAIRTRAPDAFGFDPDQPTLPRLLAPAGYTSVVVGKWHLGSVGTGGPRHPLRSGFDGHLGSETNLNQEQTYFRWVKVDAWAENDTAVEHVVERYATTETVDDVIALMEALPEPWFLWVAFHASHKPFHDPPEALHSIDLEGAPGGRSVARMKAMTQAMDTEIGRLLEAITPDQEARTTVIFLGDNGTTPDGTSPPFDPDHAKNSLYEGGVRVPLIVAGAGVEAPGSECHGLVNLTDVFATITELAGVDGRSGVDAVSLVPYLSRPVQPSLRPFIYSERFRPNGYGPLIFHRRAVFDGRYKVVLVNSVDGRQKSFYDLLHDPFEQCDLFRASEPPSQTEFREYNRLLRVLEAYEAQAPAPTPAPARPADPVGVDSERSPDAPQVDGEEQRAGDG